MTRFLFSALALIVAARAQESSTDPAAKPPTPGHSLNGEAFNEGPRQAAVLIDGTGDIRFPVSTTSDAAQRFFAQGVGQLHGFWYWEAERSFRQAAALDANCAMAYWGMAMANVNNSKRAEQFIRKAVDLKEKVSRREQLWIGSLADFYQAKGDETPRREALVKALEEISYEFPDDLEAKAFLVLQIWDNKNHGIGIPSRQAVEAVAQQVLTANPMHPGAHHYLIHLWNFGKGDKRALPSAARCGQSAPGIAHMWHMPGHTFSELKRYADAAWQQEASARVDHAYMMRTGVMPDQIHNFAHNNDWLARSLCLVGRVHDAVDLAKNMIELPRLASTKGVSYRFGRERVVDTLLRFELWDELTALEGTPYLDGSDEPNEEVKRHRALGMAWFNKGAPEKGQPHLDAIKTALETLRVERIKAAEDAEAKAKREKKSEAEITRAMAEALRKFAYRIDQMEAAIAELRLSRSLRENDLAAARSQLERVRDIPAERLARIHLLLGDQEKALQLARDAAGADEKQLQPQANLADVQWRLGKRDEAIATFKKLRDLAAQADLDVPVFERLAPIAAALGLPADWRITPVTPDDAGVRPDLSKLGPFRWQPQPAAPWSLADHQGKSVSLADYRGRAVLVVFYLGSGCARCIEQLNVFAPLTKELADAGISLVAISTDSADGLDKTLSQAKEGITFAFPILSDATLGTFKAYRAFDDFENIPLHGTFLIDGAGRVRWQDISYQPFRDGKWLLAEAKRLLAIDPKIARTASH